MDVWTSHLLSAINENSAAITTNKAGISTNTAAISTNTANISTNTENINANSADIAIIEEKGLCVDGYHSKTDEWCDGF